jgi:hypothetical protein
MDEKNRQQELGKRNERFGFSHCVSSKVRLGTEYARSMRRFSRWVKVPILPVVRFLEGVDPHSDNCLPCSVLDGIIPL